MLTILYDTPTSPVISQMLVVKINVLGGRPSEVSFDNFVWKTALGQPSKSNGFMKNEGRGGAGIGMDTQEDAKECRE